MSQTDNRPILRLADITYAVRMSPVGQSGHIVDTLVNRFHTDHLRDQLLLAVQAMFALLRDVGMFLGECVVLARLSDEPA